MVNTNSDLTKADRAIADWNNPTISISSLKSFVKQIDPQCRIEGFLYSNRKRIIFSDGSKLLFSNNGLTRLPA